MINNTTIIESINLAEMKIIAMAIRVYNHAVRITILNLLTAFGEMTVTKLQDDCDLLQSVCSQHLAILKKAGMVSTRRKGKFIYYRMNHKTVRLLEKLMTEVTEDLMYEGKGSTRQMHAIAYKVFNVLRHKQTFAILSYIEEDDGVYVREIYKALDLEQSITSSRLRMMREIGIVHATRNGKNFLYEINESRLLTLLNITSRYMKNNPV